MAGKILHFLERDGRYFARIVIPAHLRPFLDNKTELRTALGGDKKLAIKKHHAEVALLQRKIIAAEEAYNQSRQVAGPVEPRFETTIDRMIADDYLSQLRFDDELRGITSLYAKFEPDEDTGCRYRDGVAGKLSNSELLDLVGFRIERLRSEGKHNLQYGTAAWRELARGLCVSGLEAINRHYERNDGDFNGQPVDKRLLAELESIDNSDASIVIDPKHTFRSIIDIEVKRRSVGNQWKPMPAKTEAKYRFVADQFTKFRKSETVNDVTTSDVKSWMSHLHESEKYSNATIKQKIENLKTVLNWARENFPGEILANGNPAELIRTPQAEPTPSYLKAFTAEETKLVLNRARIETNAMYRWLPFLCAYTGLRISEASALTANNFFKYHDRWFIKVTTKGGRTLKTLSSERRIPVHNALVDEGFMQFVASCPNGRLFKGATKDDVNVTSFMVKWLRGFLSVQDRPELRPNHGWRHLFEDLCRRDQVPEEAAAYMTGRSFKGSQELYGRSEVMLDGLIKAIDAIKAFDL